MFRLVGLFSLSFDQHPIEMLCEQTSNLSLNDIKSTNDRNVLVKNLDLQLKTNEVACVVINHEDMTTGYMDLTGRFPQRSSSGNNYILVVYHYNANAIIAKPIKDRTATTITDTWNTIHNRGTTSFVICVDRN